MNKKEFIEKLEAGDFEYFVRERTADFVVKDDSGQAWKIDCLDFDEEDIVPAAIYAIEHYGNIVPAAIYAIEHYGSEPFKVKPVFGVVGYTQE